MMSTVLSPRSRWLLVAAAGSALLLALGWWFLVSPERATAADRLNQVANAQAQSAALRSNLRSLDNDNAQLDKYKSQLAELKQAMPDGPASAQFVSDMQTLGQGASVAITSISITPPSTGATSSTTTSTGVTELPITVAASGSTAKLEAFLAKLQSAEARALLITQVTETAPATTGSSTTKTPPTVSIQMTAFFATS